MKRYYIQHYTHRSETVGYNGFALNDLDAQRSILWRYPDHPAIVFEQIGHNPPEIVAVWSHADH